MTHPALLTAVLVVTVAICTVVLVGQYLAYTKATARLSRDLQQAIMWEDIHRLLVQEGR